MSGQTHSWFGRLALTTCRFFGSCDVTGPVDIEHARQADAVYRLIVGDQPAEIVAKPRDSGSRIGKLLRRQPIEAGCHVSTHASADLPNTSVRWIQGHPKRILVGDVTSHAKHYRVFRKS